MLVDTVDVPIISHRGCRRILELVKANLQCVLFVHFMDRFSKTKLNKYVKQIFCTVCMNTIMSVCCLLFLLLVNHVEKVNILKGHNYSIKFHFFNKRLNNLVQQLGMWLLAKVMCRKGQK